MGRYGARVIFPGVSEMNIWTLIIVLALIAGFGYFVLAAGDDDE